MLGGRAAEALTFDDISTGAHNDLSRATDIARSMIKEYGMSESVGQVYFARQKNERFLDTGMQGAVEYSDAAAELIDAEVRKIISEQYERAKDILGLKREILSEGATLLLKKEKIDGEELEALLHQDDIKSS